MPFYKGCDIASFHVGSKTIINATKMPPLEWMLKLTKGPSEAKMLYSEFVVVVIDI